MYFNVFIPCQVIAVRLSRGEGLYLCPAWYIATCKLGRPDISMYISLGFRNVMTSSSRRKLGRHCFYCFFGRFGDGQILLEINFDSKSTYSCLRSSESQSASRFLFFVFSPQKGSHGLVETGDKNRNVTDNITFSRAP